MVHRSLIFVVNKASSFVVNDVSIDVVNTRLTFINNRLKRCRASRPLRN
jgi:hypothetical protein